MDKRKVNDKSTAAETVSNTNLDASDLERIKELEKKIKELEKENKALNKKNKVLDKKNKVLDKKNQTLDEENKALDEEIEILKGLLRTKGIEFEEVLAENRELKRQVGKNSTNSSWPSSRDVFNRPPPKSRRYQTGKKPGGQKGHTGCNLPKSEEADITIRHYPPECKGCVHFDECKESNFQCHESRQVFDIVTIRTVTEHQVLRPKHCKCSKDVSKMTGQFPEDVKARTQYGDNTSMMASILSTEGAVSYSRISKLMRSFFNIGISVATIKSMVSKTAKKAAPLMDIIRQLLIRSKIACFDETGARVNGLLMWMHCSVNALFTLLSIDPKRGEKGIRHNGVLDVDPKIRP